MKLRYSYHEIHLLRPRCIILIDPFDLFKFMGTQESTSSTIPCGYDVFLSFRGKDTRKGFTDHLYTALVRAGFHTFRDDDEIEKGEKIESELKTAIEQSRISIIIFSKTYAVSSWCLNELLEILLHQKTSRIQVLPVFYDVDPFQVRWQSGSFAEAFARHEERANMETDNERRQELMKRVKRWRTTLKEVADLGGMVLQNEADGHEAKFIKKVVDVIKDKLNCRVLSIALFPVGINFRAKNINLWLQDESTVRFIAICGMGGVGKTTIAKFVYNIHNKRFDASSFLANIRERSEEPNGLVSLQKQLLSDVGREENLSCLDEGTMKIQEAMCCKRVLLVLDDADQVDQLNAIYRTQNSFSSGSKIIITTRNEQLLNSHEACMVEKVELFDAKDSLELFSWHAFKQDHPRKSYLELSERVVRYCGGLPLALQVLGSSLSGKSVEYWDSALQKLKAIPNNKIVEKLKISFHSLQDDHDRDLFLDISCFFVGRNRDLTIKILDQCGFYAVVGIQNLIDRSLLTIDMDNKLSMHQLLQDMGKEIVRLESPKEPEKRSRLWYYKDSFRILREKIGTSTTVGLILDMHMFVEDKYADSNLVKRHYPGLSYLQPLEINSRNSRPDLLETDAFANMSKLRILQLNHIELSGHFGRFPRTLRWLCWHGFPLQSIPKDFPVENLVVLEMHHSSLKQVWKGTRLVDKLKVLDLSHSHGLIETPHFYWLPNLDMLILEACQSLVEVHESIGKLERLVLLNLKNCKNLRKLPRSIGMLRCLEELYISGCSSLKELPTEMKNMCALTTFYADGIGTCKEVQPWHSHLWSLVSRPKSNSVLSISLPSSLLHLSLEGCDLTDNTFSVDFSSLSQLQYLNLSENLICGVPESIRGLTTVETLRLNSCKRLKSLEDVPNIKYLEVVSCPSLEKISHVGEFYCRDCTILLDVKDWFKLEPIQSIDIDMLRRWSFFNLDSIIDTKMKYYSRWCSDHIERPRLQRLYERGVCSYFLPGGEVPWWCSRSLMKSEGLTLRFIVPKDDVFKIQGLVLCSVYTSPSEEFCSAFYFCITGGLCIKIENKTKNVQWTHYPIVMGLPGVNEDMIWLSHWNFGNLLQDGDIVEVSMAAGQFVLKGFDMLQELDEKGETNSQSNHEATTHGVTSLYHEVIPGQVSSTDEEYFIGDAGMGPNERKKTGF